MWATIERGIAHLFALIHGGVQPPPGFEPILSMESTEPSPSQCILVEHPDRLYASGGESGNAIITHNSVVQRNIVAGCVTRSEHWNFIGIDLKKVELSDFRKFPGVLGIADELEDAVELLRFARETMYARYEKLKNLGYKDILKDPGRGPSLLVMVDETFELLDPAKGGSEAAKYDNELKSECQMIISSIARLGRAAGVFLVLATQRPDADVIPGEAKGNLGVRINCGRTDSIMSSMILGSGDGTFVRSDIRGRLVMSVNGIIIHAQGLYQDVEDIEGFLEGKQNPPVVAQQAATNVAGVDTLTDLSVEEDDEAVYALAESALLVDDSEDEEEDENFSFEYVTIDGEQEEAERKARIEQERKHREQQPRRSSLLQSSRRNGDTQEVRESIRNEPVRPHNDEPSDTVSSVNEASSDESALDRRNRERRRIMPTKKPVELLPDPYEQQEEVVEEPPKISKDGIAIPQVGKIRHEEEYDHLKDWDDFMDSIIAANMNGPLE